MKQVRVFDHEDLMEYTDVAVENAAPFYWQQNPSAKYVEKKEFDEIVDRLVASGYCRRKVRRLGRPVIQKPGMSGDRKSYTIMLDRTVSTIIDGRRGESSRSDYVESCVVLVESLYGTRDLSMGELMSARDEIEAAVAGVVF